MKKINYKKILEQLVAEYPHELDKIEKVISDASESGQSVWIYLGDIIKSNIWNSDEKARLLTIFGYSKHENEMIDVDEFYHEYSMRDYLYTIKYDIFSGFEAIMKTVKDIERYHDGSKDDSYRKIFSSVINKCKKEKKKLYLKAVLDNLDDESIRRLIKPYYEGHFIGSVYDKSIFVNILASKDLDLIKTYMGYVDDINMYLSEAVATGNIEIVKLFLENGADINYLTDEVILGGLTPLKMAIVNNDYEMAKFLIDNGADVNLQVNSEDFIDRLNNYQIIINDRWNDKIKPVNEDDKMAKELRYIRESSPLEYAIKLKKWYDQAYNRFMLYFEGESYYVKNQFPVYMYNSSLEAKNRGKIVDLIFDNLEDKKNVNYNDLIGFMLATWNLDGFKKYSELAIENNYPIDFDLLFKLYFAFHLNKEENLIVPFMDLIEKYDKDSELYLKLANYYVNNEIKNFSIYEFYVNDFNKELLNRIPEEKRKDICLVPYCKNIQSLEYLLKLGFDINQVDENGSSILVYLLCNRCKSDDLNIREFELFDYLLKNLDLSIKDNHNKTALYYAMQKFVTEDEYIGATKNWVGTRSNLEVAVADLISKMASEDVCCDDIKKVLEERLNYCSDFGDKIHLEYVYQHHKLLFEALVDKGFVLSDVILNNIFDNLYPTDSWKKDRLLKTVDLDGTLDFLYKKLDRNTEIQELDINQEYEKVLGDIDREDATFEEALKSINSFCGQIEALKQFYVDNIQKRFNPERYLEYAKESYNIQYDNLDSYLLMIIIAGIKEFGVEKLEDILETMPEFNINSYVVDGDIGGNYSFYNDEGNEITLFTGGLMQYAIMTDNLAMVQQLQERGANLRFIVDGVDHTWDYVNSKTMLEYIESVVGKREYCDFADDEKSYYLDLIGHSSESQNSKDQDVQPKKLVLKKDYSD